MKTSVTFEELQPGDVLIEADGMVVGPVTVERAADGRGYLDLVRPSWMTTLSRMYRGLGESFLIERPDAGTAKADPADEAVLKRLTRLGPQIRSWVRGPDDYFLRSVPPGRREHGERPEVGDVVLVDSTGLWRPAVVTKVGRLNVRVVYATPSAIKAESWRHFLAVLGCQRKITDVYVVTGEEWAQRAIAGE